MVCKEEGRGMVGRGRPFRSKVVYVVVEKPAKSRKLLMMKVQKCQKRAKSRETNLEINMQGVVFRRLYPSHLFLKTEKKKQE